MKKSAQLHLKQNVSRETFSKFSDYIELLKKWNAVYNLVGSKTLQDPWRRHILDGWQLAKFLKNKEEKIADLGAGAGIPGLVLAADGYKNIFLIEANQKKCSFLKEARRYLNVSCETICQRIETITDFAPDVVVSRAFAPLPKIFEITSGFGAGLRHVHLKGQAVEQEIEEAQKEWVFDYEIKPSLSDKNGSIIICHTVKKRSYS